MPHRQRDLERCPYCWYAGRKREHAMLDLLSDHLIMVSWSGPEIERLADVANAAMLPAEEIDL